MLTAVRQYLLERPVASLEDIAHHLDTTPTVARSLCEMWIQRGRMVRLAAEIKHAQVCKGCGRCQQRGGIKNELYRWVADAHGGE